MLTKFRDVGIRLDREGRFWHEGEAIRHKGLHRALLRWLDRLPDGRSILRIDETRYAYVEVEDAELLGVSAHWDSDRALLTTNDEQQQELDYNTLCIGEGNALYVRVRDGALWARLLTPAHHTITQRLEPLGTGYGLRAAGTVHPIAQRSS